MSKPLKTIPKFANETEERAFWEQHDSTDYLDWTKAQQIVIPNRLLRYGYRKNCIASNDCIADGLINTNAPELLLIQQFKIGR